MSSPKIFLSRLGQTLGPISDAEFRSLETSGKLYEYMWIWRSPDSGWEPLHAMPAAPEHGAGTSPSKQRSWAQPKAKALKHPLEAVLHDFHNMVTGGILTVSEQGCVLTCEGAEATPQFHEKAVLVLNILDPVTGQTMNVRAVLSQVTRNQGHWSYQLNWDALPEIAA